VKRFYFLSLCCLIILLVISCQKKTPEKKASERPISTPGTIIFLDTSESIKGYFRTSATPATTIQHFLQTEFRNIISENNLYPIYLSPFGSEISPPQQVQDNIGNKFVFISPDRLNEVFSAVTTNLIGVINSVEFNKYTASIIITDGIQADRGGFDIGEMLRAVRAKINEGLHLYLIGIKSEFNGFIFPEHPNPQGLKIRFWHNGLRPIYIWIASQDGEISRNLTKKIANKLRSIATSEDAVKVAGLTSVQPPDVSIELDTDSSSSPIKSKQINNDSFEWLVARTQNEVIKVPVNIEVSEDILQTNSDFKWDINLELEPKKIRWAKVIKNDEGWTLNLTYALIPSSGFMSGCSSSKGNLKVVAKAIPKINPENWWQQWSTEDDSLEQNAGKTLYLGRLSQIIEGPLRKNYPAGEVSLKAKKP
jgi:hypothetical protein